MNLGNNFTDAVYGLTEALDGLILDFDAMPDFIGSIVSFAGIFLALWAVWIGIRFLLRASRSVR